MRFALVFFMPAAVGLTHCSSSTPATPATPDAAWLVNMTGGGGSCALVNSSIHFGDSDITPSAINKRVTDLEVIKATGQTANVSCAVIGLAGGGFKVQSKTYVGADSLQINIDKVDPTATKGSPATGNVTYLSSATVRPYFGTCNFYFASNNQGVDAGKFVATFTCAQLTDGSSNPPSMCPVAESYLALGSCGTEPIF